MGIRPLKDLTLLFNRCKFLSSLGFSVAKSPNKCVSLIQLLE